MKIPFLRGTGQADKNSPLKSYNPTIMTHFLMHFSQETISMSEMTINENKQNFQLAQMTL